MVKIGTKIRQARKIKRITQEDLASAIGVSDKSISAYESDRIHPPIDILDKIARTTNQSVSYFLEDTPESSILAKLREVEQRLSEIKELLIKQK